MYKFKKIMLTFNNSINQDDLIKMVAKREEAHIRQESALEYILFVSEDDMSGLFSDIFSSYGEFEKKYINFN